MKVGLNLGFAMPTLLNKAFPVSGELGGQIQFRLLNPIWPLGIKSLEVMWLVWCVSQQGKMYPSASQGGFKYSLLWA